MSRILPGVQQGTINPAGNNQTAGSISFGSNQDIKVPEQVLIDNFTRANADEGIMESGTQLFRHYLKERKFPEALGVLVERFKRVINPEHIGHASQQLGDYLGTALNHEWIGGVQAMQEMKKVDFSTLNYQKMKLYLTNFITWIEPHVRFRY